MPVTPHTRVRIPASVLPRFPSAPSLTARKHDCHSPGLEPATGVVQNAGARVQAPVAQRRTAVPPVCPSAGGGRRRSPRNCRAGAGQRVLLPSYMCLHRSSKECQCRNTVVWPLSRPLQALALNFFPSLPPPTPPRDGRDKLPMDGVIFLPTPLYQNHTRAYLSTETSLLPAVSGSTFFIPVENGETVPLLWLSVLCLCMPVHMLVHMPVPLPFALCLRAIAACVSFPALLLSPHPLLSPSNRGGARPPGDGEKFKLVLRIWRRRLSQFSWTVRSTAEPPAAASRRRRDARYARVFHPAESRASPSNDDSAGQSSPGMAP